MKRWLPLVSILILSLLCLSNCDQSSRSADQGALHGIAEDLWGSQIDLGPYNSGLTIIEPFSPSECGHCLISGEFVELNYFAANRRYGGHNFEQCLFSPQLDIYTFQKCYRESTTVLTYPVTLHDLHRDGYPALLAFKDGEQILQGWIDDYDFTFRERARQWWPEWVEPKVLLASGKIRDNYYMLPEEARLVIVVPAADTALRDEMSRNLQSKERLARKNSVEFESELIPEDLVSNLVYWGDPTAFTFEALTAAELPVQVGGTDLTVGPYRFPKQGYGLHALMPNPHNRECYLVLNLFKGMLTFNQREPWVDFSVWKDGSGGKSFQMLVDGRFAKHEDGTWYFADSLSVVYANLKDHCSGGVCPIPSALSRKTEHHSLDTSFVPWKQTAFGKVATLGSANCRFPSIAVAPTGEAGIVWEENGDVFFCRLTEDGTPRFFTIEDGSPDSYNPRISFDGKSFIVVYLSDQSGHYYRVYGRIIDGDNLSDEFLVSAPGAFDDVTPAVASNLSGETVVAWSQWKANQRFSQYRRLNNRIPGPIDSIRVVPAGPNDRYVNAWSVNLAISADGRECGMWNQHYPAILCACGGPLTGPVSTPQKLTGDVETSECGEYPDVALDSAGTQWAIWSSVGFRVKDGDTQQVIVSHFDTLSRAWAIPTIVSQSTQTFLNQTPHLAIAGDESMWAVWSGRPQGEDSHWGIYLNRYSQGSWGRPELISDTDETARAPEIALGPDNKLWITWHSGTGEQMRTKVMVLNP